MILSTCNRVEILTVSDFPVSDRIVEFLSEYSKIEEEKLRDILYVKKQIDAVRHIFRVASSLDSMVVGEPQILGQIKDAYKWSVEFLTSGATINRIMRRAFHAAKIVKSRTDISKGAVSIAYAATLKAKELTDLQNKKILSVGVGEMNRLACEHFSDNGCDIVYIANRTVENAKELSRLYNAEVIGLDNLKNAFKDVDIVVTSTSSNKPIIKKDMIPEDRDIIIIDMALPRDTEEALRDMKNVYLVILDDLKGIVENSLKFRQKQAMLAENIIEDEIKAYEEYVASLDYDEIVKKLRMTIETVRQNELNKFKKLYGNELNDDIIEGIDKMTRSMFNKALHEPTKNIKMFMEHPEGDMYIELLKRIFKIEHSKKDVKCFFSENS
jgi:glutamyl-tRNA reductase